MNLPTPAAMRAAKLLFPHGTTRLGMLDSSAAQYDAAVHRDQFAIARRIDEATGLPELVAASREAFNEASSDNTNQPLIDQLDAALAIAEKGRP